MLNLIVEVLLYSCGDSQKCSSNDIAICTVMTLLTLSDVDDLSGVHNTMLHQQNCLHSIARLENMQSTWCIFY